MGTPGDNSGVPTCRRVSAGRLSCPPDSESICAITASSGLLPQFVHLRSSKLVLGGSICALLSRTKSLHDAHLAYNVGAALIAYSAGFTHDRLPQLGQRSLIVHL